MKKISGKMIKNGAVGLFAALVLVEANSFSVFAANDICNDKDFSNAPGCASEGGGLFGAYTSILNTVLATVGVISVVMIIVSGIMITTSAGDPGKVKKAKSAIVYSLVGLVISLLAFAIVNFVLSATFE